MMRVNQSRQHRAAGRVDGFVRLEIVRQIGGNAQNFVVFDDDMVVL
jgi:hypothetical protein